MIAPSEALGHTVIHSPHPIQSSGDTLIANLYSPAFGLVSASLIFEGAALTSSSESKNGRIVACEHTNAQLLHWIQVSGSHVGTVTAVPRFSYAEAPVSNCPSGLSMNAETGRLSPSILEIGSRRSLTILTTSGRPVISFAAASGVGFFQESGTSTLCTASTPASIAL